MGATPSLPTGLVRGKLSFAEWNWVRREAQFATHSVYLAARWDNLFNTWNRWGGDLNMRRNRVVALGKGFTHGRLPGMWSKLAKALPNGVQLFRAACRHHLQNRERAKRMSGQGYPTQAIVTDNVGNLYVCWEPQFLNDVRNASDPDLRIPPLSIGPRRVV